MWWAVNDEDGEGFFRVGFDSSMQYESVFQLPRMQFKLCATCDTQSPNGI